MSYEIADTKVIVSALKDIAGAIDLAASKNEKALLAILDQLKTLNANLTDLNAIVDAHD